MAVYEEEACYLVSSIADSYALAFGQIERYLPVLISFPYQTGAVDMLVLSFVKETVVSSSRARLSGKLLIYRRSSTGPRTVPRGTPASICTDDEDFPTTRTRWLFRIRKLSSHDSVLRNPLCRSGVVSTLSLPFKKQTTKFSSANFKKMLSPGYVILRIQRLECKQCRSR